MKYAYKIRSQAEYKRKQHMPKKSEIIEKIWKLVRSTYYICLFAGDRIWTLNAESEEDRRENEEETKKKCREENLAKFSLRNGINKKLEWEGARFI